MIILCHKNLALRSIHLPSPQDKPHSMRACMMNFELDKNHPFWKEQEASGTIALHFSGSIQALSLNSGQSEDNYHGFR